MCISKIFFEKYAVMTSRPSARQNFVVPTALVAAVPQAKQHQRLSLPVLIKNYLNIIGPSAAQPIETGALLLVRQNRRKMAPVFLPSRFGLVRVEN